MSPSTGIAVLLIAIGALLGYAALKSFRVATPSGIILGSVSTVIGLVFIGVAILGLVTAQMATS